MMNDLKWSYINKNENFKAAKYKSMAGNYHQLQVIIASLLSS